MLNLLAQTYDYEISTADDAQLAGFLAFSGATLVVFLIIAVIMIISMWKIFEKAGRPGWAALIPIYNYWVLAEISGYPGWLALVVLIAWIPVVGFIAALAVSVIVSIGLAKAFGKDPIWALLIIFLPIIALPILAFGKDKYVGPQKAKAA